MTRTRATGCGRFVVLDELHLDRDVYERIVRWAAQHGLRVQDAVQVALCAFVGDASSKVRISDDNSAAAGTPPPQPNRSEPEPPSIRKLRGVATEGKHGVRVRLFCVAEGADSDERALALGLHDVEP